MFDARASDVALIVPKLVAAVCCHDPYSLHLTFDHVVAVVPEGSLAVIGETACFWDALKVELVSPLPVYP